MTPVARPKVRKQPPKGRGTRVHEDKPKKAAKRAARGRKDLIDPSDLYRFPPEMGPSVVRVFTND